MNTVSSSGWEGLATVGWEAAMRSKESGPKIRRPVSRRERSSLRRGSRLSWEFEVRGKGRSAGSFFGITRVDSKSRGERESGAQARRA